jgi:hypothetical protein
VNIRSTIAHRRRALPAPLFSLALLSACVARSIAEPFATGLNQPRGLAFDAAAGQMYMLEFGDGRQPERPYAAGVGRLLRIAHDGSRTIVPDRLNYPTALIFSHAGDLYIAVGGAFSAPAAGAILKVPCRALGAQACPRQLAD